MVFTDWITSVGLGMEKQTIIDFHCKTTEEGLRNEDSEYQNKCKEIIRVTAENSFKETFTNIG